MSKSREILKEYEDVFRGVVKIPGEVSLKIDPFATHIAHPPSPLPAALGDAVKAKLTQIEKEGIIEKLPPGTSTPWCAPMYTVLGSQDRRMMGRSQKMTLELRLIPVISTKHYSVITTQ